jgi:hypothetical protein
MALSKSQASIWQKAKSLGSGAQAVGLGDPACAFLISTIAHDLNVQDKFPELPQEPPAFFANVNLEQLIVADVPARPLFERLMTIDQDADTYFACLAALHKARLKYQRILSTQPIPTLEQVGPRGLLQYGQLGGRALTALLFWRKWFYDIDNRAGQETGYLFEPIIASAIGGTPAPSKKSPIRRHNNENQGRQVDCVLDHRVYEFKVRVTIAASGQGRWRQELDFPHDCRASGFTPVLVCLDSTPNPKLDELADTFRQHDGEVFIGDDAWQHLDELAGDTLGIFLEKYVRTPLQNLLTQVDDALPTFTAKWFSQQINIEIAGERLTIRRQDATDCNNEHDSTADSMPDDADDSILGS